MSRRDHLADLVDRIRSAIAAGTLDAATVEAAYDAVLAWPVQTETDRREVTRLAVQLNDLLLGAMGGGAPDSFKADADRVRATAERRYGHDDTPYLRSRREVADVARRLAAGELARDVAGTATQRLLPGLAVPEDSEDVAVAIHAVHGQRAAHDLLVTPEDFVPAGDVGARLQALDAALRRGRLDLAGLLAQQDVFTSQRLAVDDTVGGHARALLVLLGIGLRHAPQALPALEPLVAAISAELVRIETHVADAAAAAPSHAARCRAFLADCTQALEAGAEVDENLLQRWVAELKALEAQPGADPLNTLDTMMDVLTLAAAHAQGDTRTMLTAQRAGLQAMREQLDREEDTPLDAAGVDEVLARMRRDAEARVAAGESAEVVMTTLVATWPTLLPRLGADPDPQAVARLLQGMVDLLSAAETSVPADKRDAFADVMATLRGVMHKASAAITTDGDSTVHPLLAQAVAHDMAGLQHLATDAQPADLAPWGRQLIEGLALLPARVQRLCVQRGHAHDDQEAERLQQRADVVLGRLRGAGADPERFVAQLRTGLRPFLLALSRFERRHHAMLVQAPYVPRASAPDANAAHLVVGEAWRPTVEAALSAAAMSAAEPFGPGDPQALRWHQLRRSAVAVLDYTGYDPARADPPGPWPDDPAGTEPRLAAAAPVAATAYEHGWALALGTPVVPLVREGSPLPFDVTMAPVALAGDGHDTDRLAAAIHGALLPDEWLGDDDGAAATVARLRTTFGTLPGHDDLLQAAGDGRDGMAVLLAAEALLQRTPGSRRMLTFPRHAPVYPDAGAPPLVFHVTAFRPWSQACEQGLRAAAERAGWRYAIGYERLDPDIMRAIWRDIAQASLVVADVSGLNPNAVLELGLAHGLGRPLIVLSRQPDTPRWLPALAKLRVHHYTPDSREGQTALASLLDAALAAAGRAPEAER